MPIYDVNYNSFGLRALPPDKRNKNMIAWINVLLSPLQYLHDIFFHDFIYGSTALLWLNSNTYNIGDRALYQKGVYESIAANNTNHVPTDVNYWRLLLPNFIGMNERINYNGGVLVLTWALNKWFGTTFRQPNNQSDIYIVNNALSAPSYRVANTETPSSKTFNTSSTEFVRNTEQFVVPTNFTIYCPVAVYNALDLTLVNNLKIFRNFVDQYVPAGVTYTVTTY